MEEEIKKAIRNHLSILQKLGEIEVYNITENGKMIIDIDFERYTIEIKNTQLNLFKDA